MRFLPARFLLPFVIFTRSASLFADTYTVTNLNDAGMGSLRQAIQQANAQNGNVIDFSVDGTITLLSALPDLTKSTAIDGTSAPGFAGAPVVCVDFNGRPGLNVTTGADGSVVKALSLVGAGNSAITLVASGVAVQGNHVGLRPDGSLKANFGDGVKVVAPSKANLIGNFDPVTGIDYADTSNPAEFTIQPVTGWQGIRNYGSNAGQYLICGTSDDDGLLYIGPIDGGGDSYRVIYPGADTIATSVYGPDNADAGRLRLVGSYRASGTEAYNYGFAWEGTAAELPSGGTFRTIDYPGATYQFTHSTMGNLAVGNADGPTATGNPPIGPGIAYIYDLIGNSFVTNIVFPNSKSNTAYGIWQNGQTNYTICGGYSPIAVNNLTDQNTPLTQGKAFLVDYDSSTNTFSNWTSFDYPNGPAGVDFVTHFEGISSAEPGVYTLSADSVQAGSTNAVQGSWVTVLRNADGTFSEGTWVDLNYPNTPDSITSSNSVYGNQVVGIVIGSEPFSYQATVNVAFQLSNVISGNGGNGISISGSSENVIAMNYIGTDPAGSDAPGFGNARNGILITQSSTDNLIGGPAFGVNNPTGSKNPANAVFQRPPQGNLISGNLSNGVLIEASSMRNVLSGNFIGTDAEGLSPLGNGLDGVVIKNANGNSLIGCTLYENPFVYYNVIAGNRGNGVSVDSSKDVTIQANFLGMGADNATSVPNGGNGLLVSGTSKNTQVGGVIPLGNVISGNTLNGIEVRDTANGFISFNTFNGIAAFQTFASPNGLNGTLVTSTGGNNTIRTCIISGNKVNGIEIGGNASGVQITDTSVGTSTTISEAIPNEGSGIVISGTAHNNAIGGFQPSVERSVYASGNKGYGIAVVDGAYNNRIFASNVGIGAGLGGPIPNEFGGILLDAGTRATTIGGSEARFQNTIESNDEAGLYINSSTNNAIIQNSITLNTVVGLYATGACNGTVLTDNTIENNGPGGTNNIDISNATGISFGPQPVPPAPPAPTPTPAPTPSPTEQKIRHLDNRISEIRRNVKNPVVRNRQIRRIRDQIRRLQRQG